MVQNRVQYLEPMQFTKSFKMSETDQKERQQVELTTKSLFG